MALNGRGSFEQLSGFEQWAFPDRLLAFNGCMTSEFPIVRQGAMSMDLHDHPTFDWLQFPEGRARFSGGVRGIMDEQGHETFAVEVDGEEYFGEIQNAFLPNGNDYNIEVVSFGYGRDGDIGMPMQGRTCRVFTAAQASTIQSLTVQLIAAGIQFSGRPSLLREYPDAHFMGHVTFRKRWALVTGDETTSQPSRLS